MAFLSAVQWNTTLFLIPLKLLADVSSASIAMERLIPRNFGKCFTKGQ
jgi:hypothetical protein